MVTLPTAPGVYIYKNAKSKIIYVGKAKNLRDRVKSYFQPPIKLGPKTAQLVENIASLEHIEVGSEIEALLLESSLIKKFKPFFNIASKDDKSPYYIHISRETYPKPVINHEPKGALVGPFLNRYIPTKILKLFRRIAPYCVAPRPVRKPCFYSHLNLCNPCPGQNTLDIKHYALNIKRLKSLLRGSFFHVRSQLSRDMTTASKKQDYEQAGLLRDQLLALEQLTSAHVLPEEYISNPNLIQDTRAESLNSLIHILTPYLTTHNPLLNLNRIEFYDNSHLAGSSPTSAMVVAVDGEITPRHYRHFTLKNKKTISPSTESGEGEKGGEVFVGNDVDYMRQVLERRLKRNDWPKPDLIVLDGGLPQLSVLRHSQLDRESRNFLIIALAKRDEIIYTTDKKEIKLPKNHPGLRLLMRLRDEAHRFSRRLHHKHQSKKLMSKI